MILPFGGILIGAILGVLMAKVKGGKTLDMLQWAAVLGMICGLIGLFALVFIERSYT